MFYLNCWFAVFARCLVFSWLGCLTVFVAWLVLACSWVFCVLGFKLRVWMMLWFVIVLVGFVSLIDFVVLR